VKTYGMAAYRRRGKSDKEEERDKGRSQESLKTRRGGRGGGGESLIKDLKREAS